MQEKDGRAKMGLEILYAKDKIKNSLADVANRDLAAELRERYWIRQAEDACIRPRTWARVGISLQMQIERHELGKDRNKPDDGFRYVFRSGTAGTGGRAEWFEVTEVFGGVVLPPCIPYCPRCAKCTVIP